MIKAAVKWQWRIYWKWNILLKGKAGLPMHTWRWKLETQRTRLLKQHDSYLKIGSYQWGLCLDGQKYDPSTLDLRFSAPSLHIVTIAMYPVLINESQKRCKWIVQLCVRSNLLMIWSKWACEHGINRTHDMFFLTYATLIGTS